MSIIVDCKDFLGFDAEMSNDISSLIRTLKVIKPYKYICYLDTNIDLNRLTPQQATNIVKKSIEEHRHGNFIFWYKRPTLQGNEKYIEDKLKNLTIDKKKVIPECIDDYMELFVNHAEKPHELLNLIADRLSNVGATAHYQIKPEDFIHCNIPIEPYERAWYSDEGNKIIDELQDSRFLLKYWGIQEGIHSKCFIIDPSAQEMWKVSLTVLMEWSLPPLNRLGNEPE